MRADRESVLKKLGIAKGQIEGLEKMIRSDRYCIDIVTQLMATDALIKSSIREVLSAHIRGCVKSSIENGESDEKLDEAIEIIERIVK